MMKTFVSHKLEFKLFEPPRADILLTQRSLTHRSLTHRSLTSSKQHTSHCQCVSMLFSTLVPSHHPLALWIVKTILRKKCQPNNKLFSMRVGRILNSSIDTSRYSSI